MISWFPLWPEVQPSGRPPPGSGDDFLAPSLARGSTIRRTSTLWFTHQAALHLVLEMISWLPLWPEVQLPGSPPPGSRDDFLAPCLARGSTTRHPSTLLQELLKMMPSSGKFQFWECKKPPVDAGTFCSSPILVFDIPPCRKYLPDSGAGPSAVLMQEYSVKASK